MLCLANLGGRHLQPNALLPACPCFYYCVRGQTHPPGGLIDCHRWLFFIYAGVNCYLFHYHERSVRMWPTYRGKGWMRAKQRGRFTFTSSLSSRSFSSSRFQNHSHSNTFKQSSLCLPLQESLAVKSFSSPPCLYFLIVRLPIDGGGILPRCYLPPPCLLPPACQLCW